MTDPKVIERVVMEGRCYDVEITAVHGGEPMSDGSHVGPASAITYDLVMHTDEGDIPVPGATPGNRRWPDSVDTVSAGPDDPVGVSYRGDEVRFIIVEFPRIDEVCA
jgi:hypothetical protein